MFPIITRLLLFLAFFSIASIAKEVPGFWTIDCGSSKSFTGNNNVTWVGDDGYVFSGESRIVRNTTAISRELTTLRVFPAKKKNCYTIPVEKDTKILVRVWFYYGNYDGLETPPEFELQFDGNHWTTVSIPDMDKAWYWRIVYVTSRNHTSVCFGRTESNQNPFVSAIEVRILDSDMYGLVKDNRGLYGVDAFAYGADDVIRYPNDKHDKIWRKKSEGFFISRATTSTFVNISTPSKPPETLLRSAVEPPFNTRNLTITNLNLPSYPVPIYFTIYFTETLILTAVDIRSFDLYVDGKLLAKNINPRYQSLTEISMVGINATVNTTFDLVPKLNSTLPPTVSGLDVMWISEELSNGTAIGDVEAVSVLQKEFKFLQEWTGDPCLPMNYSWEWIVCNSADPPRITELHLSGHGLSGILPDFGNLKALEFIDLSNNSLSGDIPEFLGNLSNLKFLNLSMNNLSSLPTSLAQNPGIKLDVSRNPNLCFPAQSCESDSPQPSSSPSSLSPPPSLVNTAGKKKQNCGVAVQLWLFLFTLGAFCTLL